jgi:hypothetical protein
LKALLAGLIAMAYRQYIFALFIVVFFSFAAIAQEAGDVRFNPRYDGVEVPLDSSGNPLVVEAAREPAPTAMNKDARTDGGSSKQRVKHIYSFSRFSGDFKELCRLAEVDGRRERLYSVAAKGMLEEQGCPTCRALLKQIVSSCYVKATPAIVDTPNKEEVQAVVTEVAEATPGATLGGNLGVSAEVTAEATVSVTEANVKSDKTTAVARRFPSTELVDRLSRLSLALYDFGPGSGAVFEALKSFERRLLFGGELTPGERDYFEVFFSYLFSSWSGRPGSPLDGRTPSPGELREMFGG